MDTRKRSHRRISYTSTESSESEPPRTIKINIKRPIKPATPPPAESDDSSELSDAPSLDVDEEEELAENMLREEEEEEVDEDDPDEDEEDIIRSIRQPLVDTSKKTARQKAKETGAADHLEFLPIEKNAKVKPILTAEEQALRKSENARKRKNQTEKKLDEEKQETINKLLNKQAGKKKGAVKILTTADAAIEEVDESSQIRKTRPVPLGMIRYINNKEGSTVSLPVELQGHVMTRTLFGDKWQSSSATATI